MDDMVAPAPQDAGKPEFARVAAPAPTSASDPLFVTVRSFDGGRHKHGPCMWEPPAGALPQVGELCVIVRAIEEDGEGEQAVVIAFDRNDSAALDSDLAAHAALTGTAHILSTVAVLPDEPVDGQEVLFQTQAMHDAGWGAWRLRYRSTNPDGSPNLNANKWEHTGGSDLHHDVATQQGTTATTATWGDLATDGPTITLPLAGVYDFQYRATGHNNVANGTSYVALFVGGTLRQLSSQGNATANITGTHMGDIRVAGITTGAIAKLRYATFGGGTSSFSTRALRATPVRVG